MAGRVLERSKRRITCRVHSEGRQHNGIVLDLSGSGLFIQTSARLSPGSRIDIDLSLPTETARMHIEVVRRKQVPAQLLTVAQGGVGVRIISAPEAFYRFLQELQEGERSSETGEGAAAASVQPQAHTPARPSPASPPSASSPPPRPTPPRAGPPPPPAAPPAPAPKPPEPPKPRFRVRVCQTQGARSRVIDTEAVSADAAARSVLAQLGDEWKLLKVEPL